MEAIIELLQQNARFSTAEIANRLNMNEQDVLNFISEMEENGTILGYHAVTDPEKSGDTKVSALIEVKLTPERDGGFDKVANRIAKFSQVVSCYLMSGGYDLLAVVEGNNLQEVARFVAEKLSTIEGVLGTSTHFQLKIYKQSGFLAQDLTEDSRPKVSP